MRRGTHGRRTRVSVLAAAGLALVLCSSVEAEPGRWGSARAPATPAAARGRLPTWLQALSGKLHLRRPAAALQAPTAAQASATPFRSAPAPVRTMSTTLEELGRAAPASVDQHTLTITPALHHVWPRFDISRNVKALRAIRPGGELIVQNSLTSGRLADTMDMEAAARGFEEAIKASGLTGFQVRLIQVSTWAGRVPELHIQRAPTQQPLAR